MMKHSMKWRIAALTLAIVALALSAFPVAPAAAGFNDWPPYPGYGSSYGCYHVVHYGETMSGIAGRYGMSVYSLMQANGIQYPNRIYAGMSMSVPCGSAGYPRPATYGYPYPMTYANRCVATYYPVQFGDNLFRIGLRYGMSANTLAYYNGLANPNLIYAGMRLVIPCSTGYSPQPYPMPGYSPQPYPMPGYSPQPYPMPGYPPQPYATPIYPPAPYATPVPMVTPMATPPGAGQVMVVMRNIAFNPAAITIRVGQTVVWQNGDSAPHTTTSGTCPGGVCSPMPGWDSGTLNPGQSFSHQFTTAGTFPYYCRIHGAMMQGTVVVMP